MSEVKSSSHRFVMAINVTIASIIVLVLVIMLHDPDEPSDAVNSSQAIVSVETVEVHGSTPIATMLVALPSDDGVYGGAEFQANVNAHLIKQSSTLLDEMNSAIEQGRTNDSLALTPQQLRDLEASGNLIY